MKKYSNIALFQLLRQVKPIYVQVVCVISNVKSLRKSTNVYRIDTQCVSLVSLILPGATISKMKPGWKSKVVNFILLWTKKSAETFINFLCMLTAEYGPKDIIVAYFDLIRGIFTIWEKICWKQSLVKYQAAHYFVNYHVDKLSLSMQWQL